MSLSTNAGPYYSDIANKSRVTKMGLKYLKVWNTGAVDVTITWTYDVTAMTKTVAVGADPFEIPFTNAQHPVITIDATGAGSTASILEIY